MNAASDIIIIGGGVIGLAIAIELNLRGAKITVLNRDCQQGSSLAAAGMLAPQAEAIPVGPMLDLCLWSRSLYPEWIRQLEQLTGVTTGYWPCGFLAPVYNSPQLGNSQNGHPEVRSRETGERKKGWGNDSTDLGTRGRGDAENGNPTQNFAHPRETAATPLWLDQNAIQLYQPGLGTDIVGGWWYPEEAQVDNRALAQALRLAAQELGIDLREGVEVEAIEQQNRLVRGIRTSAGEFQAEHYVLATGAWSGEILPLPVRPLKGQMLSLKVPLGNHQPGLQRVIYGPQTYLVPRRNGHLLVGATSEDVGWIPHNTPAGIHNLLGRAMRLYPPLQDWQIQECWWGFRPTTPDQLPILGSSPLENLFLATGHHRNGILLAPVTAWLLADVILQQKFDPLLTHFHYDRFYHSGTKAGSRRQGAGSRRQEAGGRRQKAEDSPDEKNFTTMHENSFLRVPASPRPRVLFTEPSTTNHLTIAGRNFTSRLMTGTGKYPSLELMQQSIAASGSKIVTVAVRRVQTKAPGHEGLSEALDWTKLWMLPNTAGCKTAEEAVRVARLGREMAKLLGQEENNFVKLEVIPDPKYLLPDPIGTLAAAEQLVKEGFAVLPYINTDPLLAKRLEEAGCVTVMPLGSPIGSGQGIKNAANIQIIIEEAGVPVVVDAGIGTPSEAAYAMELGADALLINSAIALAKDPVAMGRAMGMSTEAGRLAYLAGRMPVKSYASASSPLTGTIN
ncbi:MAG: glycine oxidase ThiO [Symploca sp. SIO2E6]|nr:glycine oxidase ThiO [Symploca sp. SIO2E6]